MGVTLGNFSKKIIPAYNSPNAPNILNSLSFFELDIDAGMRYDLISMKEVNLHPNEHKTQSRRSRKPKYLRDRERQAKASRFYRKTIRLVNSLLCKIGLKIVFGVLAFREYKGRSKMNKQFNITTVPLVVSETVKAKEYRIDFSGPVAVDSVRIPYSDTVEPVKVDFAVGGSYSATAGLYDENDVLIGSLRNADFTVDATGGSKSVNVVGDFTVTDA